MSLSSPSLQQQQSLVDDDGSPKEKRRSIHVRRVKELIGRIPRRYRIAFFVLWLGWKVLSTAILLYILWNQTNSSSRRHTVLHIVTSTMKTPRTGNNTSAMDAVLSVASLSGKHMNDDGFDVDLFLILDASLSKNARQRVMITNAAMEVWDDATPFDQAAGTIHRQHRFVIKDKLLLYDLFVVTDDATVVPRGILGTHLDREPSQNHLQERSSVRPTLIAKSESTDQETYARTLSLEKNGTVATGWIASPSQIFQWHTHVCSFLPPFLDDQDTWKPRRSTTPEWWIGGGQLVSSRGEHGCGLI